MTVQTFEEHGVQTTTEQPISLREDSCPGGFLASVKQGGQICTPDWPLNPFGARLLKRDRARETE